VPFSWIWWVSWCLGRWWKGRATRFSMTRKQVWTVKEDDANVRCFADLESTRGLEIPPQFRSLIHNVVSYYWYSTHEWMNEWIQHPKIHHRPTIASAFSDVSTSNAAPSITLSLALVINFPQ
jgi:hypothetical protein